MTFTGKMDDQGNVCQIDQRVVIKTPLQKFENKDYKNRVMISDPINGQFKYGYNNVDSTFMQHQMNDSTKNAMITSSVDVLRVANNKSILRNDWQVRSKTTNFINTKERKRTDDFNVD